MENLSDILKSEAVERDLCAQWTAEWADDSSQQELIEKYKRGLDFIIKQGEWPSNGFIKANFDRDLLNANLIFVDEYVDIDMAQSGIYVLNGDCHGRLSFAPWAAATVYLRHNSKVTIAASDFAKVFVRLYDRAEAETESDEGAFVRVLDRRK